MIAKAKMHLRAELFPGVVKALDGLMEAVCFHGKGKTATERQRSRQVRLDEAYLDACEAITNAQEAA